MGKNFSRHKERTKKRKPPRQRVIKYRDSHEFEEEAYRHWEKGNCEKALAIFKKGLLVHPGSPTLLCGVGYSYLAMEEYLLARRSFEEAYKVAPAEIDVLIGLGESLLPFSEYENALSLFRQALMKNSQNEPEIPFIIARSLCRMGMWKESKALYCQSLNMGLTNEPELFLGMGICGQHLGETDFKKYIQKAIELEPHYYEALSYLGNVLYDEGNFKDAFDCFKKIPPEFHGDPTSIKRAMLMAMEKEDIDRVIEYAIRLSDILPHLGTPDEVMLSVLDGQDRIK